MERFDSELRDTADWADWEENRADRYAIEHDERRYPVKQIISTATGIPVSDFSGGQAAGNANRYDVGKLMRRPRSCTTPSSWLTPRALDLAHRKSRLPAWRKPPPIWSATAPNFQAPLTLPPRTVAAMARRNAGDCPIHPRNSSPHTPRAARRQPGGRGPMKSRGSTPCTSSVRSVSPINA
jgi:hypothetical protein